MDTPALIFLSLLILLGYLFEVSARATRIPTVILLIALGVVCREGASAFGFPIPNLDQMVKELGTLGLLLIVLEGSMELELKREKLGVIGKTFYMALFPMIIFTAVMAYYLSSEFGTPYREGIINALPLSIISSAIAVPTARMLGSKDREFVVFESSFSDILGVLFFNFVVVNEVLNQGALLHFGWQILISIVFAFVGAAALSLILSRLRHRIKFIPIIALIMLMYSLAKFYHLPALILILIFGLFLANFQKLERFAWFHVLRPAKLTEEVHKFADITFELTFVVRVAFFLLFGFLLDYRSLVDWHTLGMAGAIVALVHVVRGLHLKLAGLDLFPLLFIAPRGLITVLLVVSIPASLRMEEFNNTLITQVVVMSALFMMVATLFVRQPSQRAMLDPQSQTLDLQRSREEASDALLGSHQSSESSDSNAS